MTMVVGVVLSLECRRNVWGKMVQVELATLEFT
jgi:hypothetical protein